MPTYLDSVAIEILASSRETAAQCARFEPRAQPFEGGVRLFVWGGSRVQQTLTIAFAAAGLRYSDEGVGFEVGATPIEVRKFLNALIRNPNPSALAAFADERMRLRELGHEKFEPFLPSNLWRRAFIAEQLAVEGAVEIAENLANALADANEGVS